MQYGRLSRAVLPLAIVVGLAFAPAGLAQTPTPEGCPGSVKTTNVGGEEAGTTNENRYTPTEDVFLQGSGFPNNLTQLTFTIEDVSGGAVIFTGRIPGGAAVPSESFMSPPGQFLEAVWTAAQRVGVQGHEFKVTVTYIGGNGQTCQKSDNFFIISAPVPPRFAGQVAAAGAAQVAGVAIIPTAACPSGIRVTPRQIAVGRRAIVTVRVRRDGQAVENALVVLRGPGIERAKATGASGVVRFRVRATRRGVVRVFVPNVCAARAGVFGAVAGGGGGLTG